MATKKRILILSAYDAPSHQYLNDNLQEQFPEYDWELLALPARYFAWRARSNSLTWAWSQSRTLLEESWDLVIATSMVDISALRGFVPSLGQVPLLVYCHENQFAYPENASSHSPVERQLTQIYTLLCADRVLFNSGFNRDTLLEGMNTLLTTMPDHVPAGLTENIAEKAVVLPVPLTDEFQSGEKPADRLHVVWNHRWEYDKGIDRLLAAVEQCVHRHLPVRFHILGQHFRKVPPEFDRIYELLDYAGMKGEWGFQNRDDYLRTLGSSHVVLSTALHDFQGLAVMDGVASGALPLVPDRLAYPQWYQEDCRYLSAEEDMPAEVNDLVSHLTSLCDRHSQGRLDAPALEVPMWSTLRPAWQQEIERLFL